MPRATRAPIISLEEALSVGQTAAVRQSRIGLAPQAGALDFRRSPMEGLGSPGLSPPPAAGPIGLSSEPAAFQAIAAF
jgi:hypothetical protein